MREKIEKKLANKRHTLLTQNIIYYLARYELDDPQRANSLSKINCELSEMFKPPIEANADTSEDLQASMKRICTASRLTLDSTMRNASIAAAESIMSLFRRQLDGLSIHYYDLLFSAIRSFMDFGFVFFTKVDKHFKLYNPFDTLIFHDNKGEYSVIAQKFADGLKTYDVYSFTNLGNYRNQYYDKDKSRIKEGKWEIKDNEYIIYGKSGQSAGALSIESQNAINHLLYLSLQENEFLANPPLTIYNSEDDNAVKLTPYSINRYADVASPLEVRPTFNKSPYDFQALQAAIDRHKKIIVENYKLDTLMRAPEDSMEAKIICDIFNKLLKHKGKDITLTIPAGAREFEKSQRFYNELSLLLQMSPETIMQINMGKVLENVVTKYEMESIILSEAEIRQKQQYMAQLQQAQALQAQKNSSSQ